MLAGVSLDMGLAELCRAVASSVEDCGDINGRVHGAEIPLHVGHSDSHAVASEAIALVHETFEVF